MDRGTWSDDSGAIALTCIVRNRAVRLQALRLLSSHHQPSASCARDRTRLFAQYDGCGECHVCCGNHYLAALYKGVYICGQDLLVASSADLSCAFFGTNTRLDHTNNHSLQSH